METKNRPRPVLCSAGCRRGSAFLNSEFIFDHFVDINLEISCHLKSVDDNVCEFTLSVESSLWIFFQLFERWIIPLKVFE